MITSGAIILAGGQSRRMGRNKALLRLTPDGPPLIEIVIAAARSVATAIVLSTNDPAPYAWLGLPTMADRFPGAGPLAGLEAGLSALPTDAAFLLACDMPAIVPELLRLVRDRLGDADAVVPLNAVGQPEPLCALYRPACLPAIRARLAAGDFAMRGWLADVRTIFIPAADLRAVDPDLRSFRNLNTPADLAAP